MHIEIDREISKIGVFIKCAVIIAAPIISYFLVRQFLLVSAKDISAGDEVDLRYLTNTIILIVMCVGLAGYYISKRVPLVSDIYGCEYGIVLWDKRGGLEVIYVDQIRKKPRLRFSLFLTIKILGQSRAIIIGGLSFTQRQNLLNRMYPHRQTHFPPSIWDE